jgi:predicted  nucleic acid-binding Zn-ribbon protein
VEEQTRLRLQKDVLLHSAAKLKELDNRNLSFFKVEENRIYQWEHDVIDGIEAELSTIKKQILQTERDARNAESVTEKLALEKKVDDLKRKKRRLRNELDDREEEVSEQRRAMITELEQRMVKQTEQQNLFVIRWKVKEN